MKVISFDVGMKNLAYCVSDNDKIIDWNVIELKPMTKEDLCCCIVRTLDGLELLNNSEIVLIEKQPSRNNKMRIIEALLNAYFVIRGSSNSQSSISKVIVYSAKHKLGKNTFKGMSSYRERKKLGIARTIEFLNSTPENEEMKSLFAASKKKDDLADSLLMALAYNKSDMLSEISTRTLPEPIKIVCRKPTSSQEKKGYSKSNLKWLLINKKETFHTNSKIIKAANKWYLDVEDCIDKLAD
jgi:hypothetical protein